MQDRTEDALNEKVMESLGNPEEKGESVEKQMLPENKESELPKFAKEKLGMQEKRHKKEIRKLQSQLDELRNHLTSQSSPMESQNNYNSSQMNSNDPIQQAVAAAMQALEDKQKKQRDNERLQHVQKQYQDLQTDLDNASDKYEDFDDVVRSPNATFTEAMRDASLIIPNRADVLYKLGKNPDELNRISKLHPIDQAKEMVKLSIALMSGNGDKMSQQSIKTMGNIKNNPVPNSSAQVNENTPVSDIRRRMKAGWK